MFFAHSRSATGAVRRLVLAAALGALIVSAFVALASAATTTGAVGMTFNEPVVPDFTKACPVFPNGFCGSGAVVPFGHAIETIVFGGACDGNCDLRTINLASGTIYLHETSGNGTCKGACTLNPGEPGASTLTDTIVGGTGIFAGATGSLSGHVSVTSRESVVKLSGSITLTT